MEAKKQLLIKAYKTMFSLESKLNNIEAERAENVEKLAEAEKDFKKNNPTGTVDIGGFTLGMVGGEAGYFGTETAWDSKNAERVDSYRNSIELADQEIEKINGDLAEVNRTITYLNRNDFSKVFDDGAKSAGNASSAIGTETEEIGKYNDATKGARKSAVDFADENERIGGIKLDLSDEEMDEFKDATDDATKSTSDYKDELIDTRQKVVNLKSTTDAFGNQIDKYGNTVDTATGKTKNFGTTVKNVDGKLVNAKGEVINLHSAMQELVQMRVEKMASADAIADMNTKLKAVHAEVDALTKGLDIKTSADVEAIINLREELYKARMEAYMLTGYKPVLSANQQKKADEIMMEGILGIDAYASGGWPDEGQLFLSREAGPEMVGTIGGRTAVATNQDIVAAVADGVYNAVMSASSITRNNGGGDVNVVLQLDDYQFGNAVIRSVNSNTRRTGQLQIEGI